MHVNVLGFMISFTFCSFQFLERLNKTSKHAPIIRQVVQEPRFRFAVTEFYCRPSRVVPRICNVARRFAAVPLLEEKLPDLGTDARTCRYRFRCNESSVSAQVHSISSGRKSSDTFRHWISCGNPISGVPAKSSRSRPPIPIPLFFRVGNFVERIPAVVPGPSWWPHDR
jgi:hypothetical protein